MRERKKIENKSKERLGNKERKKPIKKFYGQKQTIIQRIRKKIE